MNTLICLLCCPQNPQNLSHLNNQIVSTLSRVFSPYSIGLQHHHTHCRCVVEKCVIRFTKIWISWQGGYFEPGRSATYLPVCLPACLTGRSHISKTTHQNFTTFFYTGYLWPWLAYPLMATQYVVYFRFVDDVIFYIMERSGHNQIRRVRFVEFARSVAKSDFSDCTLLTVGTQCIHIM